ncbi:MAG: acetylglutamate kinase [Chitinophagaceae bacterium]
MEPIYIIKIGGNVIDDPVKLSWFLEYFSEIPGKKILVHGGGKLATELAEQLGVKQQMIDGRRVTDAETLKIVTMVYAGYINKSLVARLQFYGINALGLTGADANLLPAKKREHPTIDYGFVGDIESKQILVMKWMTLLNNKFTLVMAPITHDNRGQLLNTNADSVAQEIATVLGRGYEVHLIYCFEKKGVLRDVNDEDSVISRINPAYYAELKEKGLIFAGMLPKLENAFAAVNQGVKRVVIGQAEQLLELVAGIKGTTISNE